MENQFYITFKEFKDEIKDFFENKVIEEEMRQKLKRFASDCFHIRKRELLSLLKQPVKTFEFNSF